MTQRHHPYSVQRGLCLTLLAIAWSAIGCSHDAPRQLPRDASEPETLELRFEAYAGVVGFPELAQDLGYLAPVRLNFVGSTIGGPHSIQSVVTGDTDFGAAFNGAIIRLAAAKAPIQAVLSYYGADEQTFEGFYVLADSPIRNARDLIGKKVSLNTLGAHSELMLREYLLRAGISREEAKQVTLVVLPPINAEQSLRQRQTDVASLGRIFRERAVEQGGLRLLFSDHELYGSFNAGSIVMSKEFIAKHPNTVRKFVQATAKAIEWAKKAPREEVVARMQKIIAARSRSENVEGQKYWRSTAVATPGGRIADHDFQRWIDWMVKDGELEPNRVSASDLYTNAFQAPSGG